MTTSVAALPRRGLLLLAVAAVPMWLVADVAAVPGTPAAEQAAPPPGATAPAGPAAPAAAPPTSGVDFVKDREAIFDAFYTTGLDTSKPYAVTNLAIRKDSMTLLLKQGTVFFMQPIAGEVTGAAFVGQGEASMTPPNRTERYMLNKYYGAEVLKEPFSEAVFRFSDGTDRTIRAAARPDPGGSAQAARAVEIFKDRNGWLDGTRELQLEMPFLETRISGLKGLDPFLADFHSSKHDWLSYRHEPQEIMENLLTSSETLGAKSRRYLVPWSEWHKQSDYGPSGHYLLFPERDGPRLFRIRHNQMDITLPNTKTVQWQARVRIEPQVDDLRAFRFDLVNNAYFDGRWDDTSFYPARVESVTDEAGQPLQFTHKRDQLLVVASQPAKAGSSLTMVFKGSADMVYQLTAESFGLIQVPWYPQYGFIGGRSSFHWTVRVPRPFLITGSGRREREFEDKEANLNGLEMKCDLPARLPWVIFGRFQKASNSYVNDETKRSVGLTIHSFPTMTVSITDPDDLQRIGERAPVTIPLSAPLKKINGFFEEGKEVLKLYEKIFGPYPYDELHIAQMAPFLGFGQAPQGFVQLTGDAFMSQAQQESDFIHGFLAHEFAHQWWFHQVGEASMDDQWLSEAFAEYASGIFVNAYQGPKRFQRELEEWRRYAKYSDKEAPIAAANTLRFPPEESSKHRSNLLYSKGPYVLHMLRVQLNDDKYMQVMRGIQEAYRHQNVSTEMLVSQVNKITGSDYTYFFDQWFWDVGIPTFKYSWRTEKQADGKYMITVHVSQQDSKNFKKVLMPVHIHFRDKTIPQYKPVVQAEQDIKILCPVEPKNVTLDDDRTLLAEFVKAG